MSRALKYEDVSRYFNSYNYTLLSTEYVDAKSPLQVRCPKGHEYPVNYNNFKYNKRRCPDCSRKRVSDAKRIPTHIVESKVTGAGYKLHKIIEGYKGEPKRIIVSCDRGHEPYEVTYQNFRRRRRCPDCKAEKNRTPIEEVRETFRSKGYTLLSTKYVNNRSRIYVKCPEGHDYPTTYGSFKANKGCSVCNTSKGERLVESLLKSMIPTKTFYAQYAVRINNRIYRYDFCVIGERVKLLIEYDGEGHYKPIEVYGGEKGLKDTQRNDRIKDNYVENNPAYRLLRIPYWYTDEEIQNSIDQYLRENNVDMHRVV